MHKQLREALISKNFIVVQRFTSKGKQSLGDDKFLVAHLLENNWSLIDVIRLGNLNITKLFLEDNDSIKINDNNSDGKTALHEAVIDLDIDHVKLLLDHNADPNSVDDYSRTPIYYLYNNDKTVSREEDILDIIKVLINKGVYASINRYRTSRYKHKALQVKYILEKGNVNAIESVLNMTSIDLYTRYGDEEYTVLHYLARNSNLNVWETMRNRDFDVNAQNAARETSLWLAAKFGNVEAVRFLLSIEADVNVANERGFTPIYVAAIRSTGDRYVKCIELLLQHGAEFHKPSILNDCTVLDVVFERNDDNLCRILLSQAALEEANGIKIQNRIGYKIDSESYFKKYFEACKKLVETEVYSSITLAKLLTCSEEKLIPYMRNENLVEKIGFYSEHLKSIDSSYYHRFLEKRLKKASELAKLRDSAAVVIGRLTKIHNAFILDLIINKLDHRDLITLKSLQF